MRILIYGPNYAPEKTGTGKYTAEMAQWFAARGHEVEVIAGPPHYPEWRVHDGFANKHTTTVEGGVLVRRVPMYVPKAPVTTKGRIRMESSFSFHAARPWLAKLLGRRPDVVIAVCPPMQVAIFPRLLQLLRGVPWVFHVQDLQVDAAVRLGMVKPSAFTRLLYRIEQRLLRKATRASTITSGMQRRLEEKGVDSARILQVPNWSDVDFVVPAPRNNAFRQSLGVSDDQLVLLYAGNMGKKQGLELIIQAADQLRTDARFQFVLVGDGAERNTLEAQAKLLDLPNMKFLPLQPWEDVPDMLNAADIHLVVQRQEAADLVMPSKLTNILAAGGCAIGTVSGGTLFDVLSEVGVVVEPEDAGALATAIVDLAAADRTHIKERARAWAEENLRMDHILLAFEKELHQISRQRR